MKISANWRARIFVINWFGLVQGILMVLLAILAPPWWELDAGAGALTAAISPFNVEISALRAPIYIPLVQYVCLGARLAVLIAGALLVIGSLFTKRWWSRRLVRFGATKLFWMVAMLIIMLVLTTFVANYLLPRTLPGFSLPYISGSTTAIILVYGVTAILPIVLRLTDAFWVAVLAAALGVATRIYHRRFVGKV